MSYLLDSNVLIDYVGHNLPLQVEAKLDALFLLADGLRTSVIVRMEVLGFADIADNDLSRLADLLEGTAVYNIDERIDSLVINIRKANAKCKLPDTIIAATAMAYGHSLISHNLRDFRNIEGLSIIDSHVFY